jgi:hypothetical protein
MARLRQLYPARYGSQSAVHSEFENLVRYLNAAEIGNKTVGEILSQIFDSKGDPAIPIQFRFDPAYGLQARWGETADWTTIAAAEQIRGPAGVNVGLINPLNPVSGLMFESSYTAAGMLRWDKVAVPDAGVAIQKVAGLQTALDSKVTVTVGANAPLLAEDGDLWVNTADPANPALQYYYGSSWFTDQVSGILPLPGPNDALKFLRVKADGKRYELSTLNFANILTSGNVGQAAGVAGLNQNGQITDYQIQNNSRQFCVSGVINGALSVGTYNIGLIFGGQFDLVGFAVATGTGSATARLVIGNNQYTSPSINALTNFPIGSSIPGVSIIPAPLPGASTAPVALRLNITAQTAATDLLYCVTIVPRGE